MTKPTKQSFLPKANVAITALIFLFSCGIKHSDKNIHQQLSKINQQAIRTMNENPKRAIFILDSALNQITITELPDSLLTDYFLTKSDALIKQGLKDSAYNFAQQFKEAMIPSKNRSSIISTCLWMTEHLVDDGKIFLASKYLEETMQHLAEMPDNKEKSRALNLQGTILTFSGDYLEAQKKFLEAIGIMEELNITKPLGPVFINLANNYKGMKDDRLALHYYWKACSITNSFHDSVNYIIALNNLGIFYLDSRTDSSEYYFTKARDIMPLNFWSVESLSSQFNLANLYLNQGKFQQALDIYNYVIDISRQYKISKGVYSCMSGIGNVYESLNKDSEALRIFQEAAVLAGEAGETPVQLQLFEAIRYMYDKAGNFKEAYLIHRKIKQISDSLFATEKQIAVRDLEMMYNNEKIERKNELLNSEMRLMKNQIRTNRIIIVIVVLFALILGIMLRFIYRLYRQRDNAYNTLFEKYRNDIQSGGVASEILPAESDIQELSMNTESQSFKKLVEYLENEKPYLNSNLKIEELALKLNINQKTLSSIVYENSGMRLINFVNNYRVKEALQLLADTRYRNYKIEAIAKEAGFGSKVSFYSAFSQITGQKPGDFREKN